MNKFFLCASNDVPLFEATARDLLAGRNRHDVLVDSIRILEQDPSDDSVGYGGYPDLLGNMSLDAAFMDGNTRNCGSVAGVKNYLPVRLARYLMEEKLHTFLQGEGAELFAADCRLKSEPTLYEAQKEKWARDIKPLLDNKGVKSHMDIVRQIAFPKGENLDTAIMIASDGSGISGASSTAGWPYKHPGRVGDAPIIGAGLYVDSRFGGSCCTWTGEMSTRASTAHFVVSQMQAGKTVRDAVLRSVDEISRLREGLLQTLVIHAIDFEGKAFVAAINAAKPIFYQYWSEGMVKPERREAEPFSVSFSDLKT